MIAYDEAVALVTQVAQPLGTEVVGLDQAHGRVLARAVTAQMPSPFADVSSMDGYAVRRADVTDLPTPLRVTGEARPGRACDAHVTPGTAVRIFTGAPLPVGADWVVIQENVRREGDVAIVEAVGAESHIRATGSDFARGDVLVEAGSLLTPRALVAAAAADLAELTVWRRPRVRLIATGDELAEPGAARIRPGSIPDSISIGLAALVRDWGGEVVGHLRLADDLPAMQNALREVQKGADLLIVTGGASVGERDFAKAMFGDALDLIFSKVAMKPGKPVWLGLLGEVLVIGLPGNPTSALVTARLLLAPLLARMTGRDAETALCWVAARLAADLPPPGDRETFSRACWRDGIIDMLPNQDSGAQKMLVAAELLIRRPTGLALGAGDPVATLNF